MKADDIPVVLDVSVAIARIGGEETSTAVRAKFAEWIRHGRTIVVPSLFWIEFVNVLGITRRLPGNLVLEAVHELDRFGLITMDVDRLHLVLTIDLMERHRLTAYDATYLALSTSLHGDLATLDRRLAQAAGPSAIYLGPDPPPRRLSEEREPYGAEPTWPDFAGASAYLARLRAESRKARTIG